MAKVGRPKGKANKLKKGPFWFTKDIVGWLSKKKNMTSVIEKALRKEMEKDNE
jgi:hypothetical protein